MMEIIIIGTISLFFGALMVYLYNLKTIDAIKAKLTEAEKRVSVRDAEIKLISESMADKLKFKDEMLEVIASQTADGQKPYLEELIKDSQRLKEEATKIEKQKSENDLKERELLRLQAEANIKKEYSSTARGLDCQQVMERIITSSGYEVGKSVIFNKKQDGIKGIPDATLIYPSSRKICVDAKSPLGKFDEIIDAGLKGNDQEIKKLKIEFGKKILDHLDWLSGRGYERAKNSEDYILMFLPSSVHEQMARECVQLFQKDLDEQARKKKIYIVSPGTFTPYVQNAYALWTLHENTQSAEETLAIVRKAFNAARILGTKILNTKKQIKTAYDGAKELETSYNSTFIRASDQVTDTGYKDENVVKIKELGDK